MLPKKHRIKKGDFQELITSGRSFYSPHLTLRALKVPKNVDFNQFGVVVSKKVSNKASTRNFLKRRLKYALVKVSPTLKKGFTMAIWFKKDLSTVKYIEFEAEVITLLKQANLINA